MVPEWNSQYIQYKVRICIRFGGLNWGDELLVGEMVVSIVTSSPSLHRYPSLLISYFSSLH